MSTKTFASNIVFQLGLATLTADAVPIKRVGADKAVAFNLVCGTHATRPSQQYYCAECDKHYYPNELARAKELDDGSYRVMEISELEAVKEAALEPGVFAIQVCPKAELEARTSPSGQAYRLRLGKKGSKAHANAYALFRALASDPANALYGVARLNARCAPTPFRLKVWRDQLFLEGLIRPQDLTEPEVIEGDVTPDLLEMGRKLVATLSAPLDEEFFEDERAKRLGEILNTEASVSAAVVPAAKGDEPDLMSLLAASLQAA